MSETSRQDLHGADPDEAAFKRLADGLAALRRETDRLRDTTAVATAPFIDQQAVSAALAEINKRIDALAGRNTSVEPRPDTGPVLAALAVVEDKIGTLTSRLDRFAEKTALTQGLAKLDAKIDTLAARLDARLNRVQELHDQSATQSVRSAGSRRGYLLALLVFLLMLAGAAGAIALARPDLVSDHLRQQWVTPVRDTVKQWLRISQAEPPPAIVTVVIAAAPERSPPVAESKPAEIIPAALVELAAPEPARQVPEVAAVDPVIDAALPAVPQIVLAARSDAWLVVRGGDGHTLLARTLHAGETWKVPDQPGLRLTTGNAAATIVRVDGTEFPISGGVGGVRRDVPLDARLSPTASR
jgi:nucleotide-binding universal stress UspA family protein